jgi:hypothetical protein
MNTVRPPEPPARVPTPPLAGVSMPSAVIGRFVSRALKSASIAAALCFVDGSRTDAAEPLSARIDKLVAAKYSGPKSAQADDAEFLRRIYLDLVGRTPTVAESRKFLDDKAADKRAKLVDLLLNSAEHPRRMTEAFNAMLMERRGDNEEWTKFLSKAFQENRPWDEMVRQIIDPSEDDESLRGAAHFAVNRLSKVGQQDTDYPGLTRDVGRLFLGMDLQCAQCHDHLFIDAYKQVDFQGLYTVFLNTTIRTDVKFPALQENLMTKKMDFQSVFTKEPMAVGPRVPGLKEISIPSFKAGEEYLVKPDRKTKVVGVPKFSPLEALADNLTETDNRAFRENIANRLWWLVMGRGLVDPLDQQHVDNTPSHPELLQLLGDEMKVRKFDIRSMIRDLVLSETYARASGWDAKSGARPAAATYAAAVAKPMSAEQMFHSFVTATGPQPADANLTDIRARFVTAYANPPKEPEIEFAPSVKAALFLSNDTVVLELLKPKAGNLVERLAKQADAGAAAEELYLAVLARRPTDEERSEVRNLIAKHGSDSANESDRAKLYGMLTWALVSSTEFCLNH